MRLCSGAGCGRAIKEDAYKRFCDECQAERGLPVQSDDTRVHTTGYDATLDALRKGTRWQRLRLTVLSRDPICKRCDTRLSVLVDHIVPAAVAIVQAQESGRWPTSKSEGYYLSSNLQGLCSQCHGDKTMEDKVHVGEWASVVAAFDAAPRRVWRF